MATKNLEVKVLSASGIVGGTGVWDKAEFDGYVKVEMRGGDGVVKARTAAVKSVNQRLYFDETMTLPIPTAAEEVRLKICKEKKRGIFGSSVVIANAGIYLKDLLRFVPIEKDFNLFKPTDRTDGGSIKLFFDYKGDRPVTAPVPAVAAPAPTPAPQVAAPPVESAPATLTPQNSNVGNPPTPSPAPKAAPAPVVAAAAEPVVKAAPAAQTVAASASAPPPADEPPASSEGGIGKVLKSVVLLAITGYGGALVKKKVSNNSSTKQSSLLPPPPQKKNGLFGK
mmetsp:Transcript_19506/g.23374  ORF Transcript_19506/g.23374 Transcript_19506/m.23374 type:complete len:282 (-) Transcript_19506:359-1204(-)|eukprot:CAMPEP_0197849394 /NCGR_PEP_ID=MMETSP1438-20131217/11896_1 /TAXON_ID=1461541 /ORGANISM="Pterosperma sp., Strain CCMP1384" /LENGTH=281 /DNA_ID=CAMNT_0043462057 /DNA_START=22 /DNA_END=867 /DNA_ORIENTATION=+